MDKRRLVHIIEWVIAIAACAYLVYKLATYEDYATLGACLRSMGWLQWLAIELCVLLMPVNMALEAWRWRTLMNESRESRVESQERLSFNEAQRQVYYSKLAGLITPWRLGEYPARALVMEDESRESRAESRENERIWAKVLAMGAVGSATMTLAIILAGVAGLAFSPAIFDLLGGSYLYSVGIIAVVIGAFFALMPKLLQRWATITQELLLRSIGQSLVRLACWCVQLALVLWAVDGLVDAGISGLVANTFVYYLLVTITPNVPVVEVGVRGAWAIVVFGTMNAALAGVLLWAINTLLPCVIGIFLRKKRQ